MQLHLQRYHEYACQCMFIGINYINMSHYKKTNVQSLRMLPNLLASQLMTCSDSVEAASKMIQNSNNVIFIGRGHLTSKLVEEGALKMMEVSYIPAWHIQVEN